MPEESRYDGYIQLENGVGMLRLLYEEFKDALDGKEDDGKEEELSIATGYLAYPYICEMAEKITDKCPNVRAYVYPIRNDFFGELITVSGLVTGQDLISQLKEKELGEVLLLPCNMFRSEEDVFLDDVTLAELGETLQVRTYIVKSSGQDLIEAITGKKLDTGGCNE